jgi:hypothetical protein
MSDWNDVPKRLGSPENDTTNLDGGPDLDTVRDDRERDEAENPRTADKRSGAPTPTAPPDPAGRDPHLPGAPDHPEGVDESAERDQEERVHEYQHNDPTGEAGPSYEKDQGTRRDNTGGSTDPNNTRTHADSGHRPEE